MNISPFVAAVEAPPIAEALTWVRQGPANRELLNLCQAVPSYPPAEALQEEVGRLAHDPTTGLYTDIYGIPELREALARHMSADYRGQIRPDDTAITAGCNQAFSVAMMALARAGDEVILPSPWYFNHQMWLTMLGITPVPVSAFGEGRSWPDVQEAEAAITPRTRAIVLCSPNNPTGAIYPPDVIAAFHALARRRGIALVLDETYKDFRPHPEPLHSLFSAADWRDSFIQLYSFSKAYAITGYRVGSIIAGNRLLAEMGKVLDCMTICAPHISQRAVVFALSALDDWKAGKKAMMAERGKALIDAFGRKGLRYHLQSSGAYFAYVRHPFQGTPAKAVAMRLAADHDVLCLPGSMFGPNQEDYLRFAYANAEADRMESLVDRLMESQG